MEESNYNLVTRLKFKGLRENAKLSHQQLSCLFCKKLSAKQLKIWKMEKEKCKLKFLFYKNLFFIVV